MKQAIILASFGVSDPKIRTETFELIESEVRQTFPDIEVVQTYTSEAVRYPLKLPTVDEYLRQFADKKIERTIVVPIFLTWISKNS